MTHISNRNSRSKPTQGTHLTDGLLPDSPLDQSTPADRARDHRLAVDLAGNPRIERIARLRKETTATESEADGVLTDHDQVERGEAHAPPGIAPDPNMSEIMD